MTEDKVYAADLCTFYSHCLSRNELDTKLRSGDIQIADFTGWSWLIINDAKVVIFAKVIKTTLHSKFVMYLNMIHVNTVSMMHKFHSEYIVKSRESVWKADNEVLSYPNAGASVNFAGCAKHIGLLEPDSISGTIIGLPAVWLLAEVIAVTQVALGITNATVDIRIAKANITSPALLANNRMPLVHITPNQQTIQYWSKANITRVLVLTDYNNCIVG